MVKKVVVLITAALILFICSVIPQKVDASRNTKPPEKMEAMVKIEGGTGEALPIADNIESSVISSESFAISPSINAFRSKAEEIDENDVDAEDESMVIGGQSVINKVPRYNQLEYSHVPYSYRNVATSGCGIVCVAMVATYLLDEECLPDELAREYNWTGSDNITRMQNASDGLGLEFEMSYDWNHVLECLREGKVAIALVNSKSIFTDYGHLIVLTGITEDGKIVVNDPNGASWNKYPDEFKNGFSEIAIVPGFAGAWIYEKDDETDRKGVSEK